MDKRKLAYLDAMGIDVWLPRQQAIHTPVPAPDSVLPLASSPLSVEITEPPRDFRVFEPAAVPDNRGSAALSCEALDWEALQQRVASCTLCELHQSRSNVVFGVGNRSAEWMIIGEAPGADEDRQGEPFVGRAGQLLTAMLEAIGLKRSDVYIANILKCRPPNNRDPRPEEAACCTPYLNRQIELIRPKLIFAVGKHAAHFLLKTDAAIGKLRGQEFRYEATGTPVVVSYHPAYLLRSPGEKRKAWEDLKLARRIVEAAAEQEGENV